MRKYISRALMFLALGIFALTPALAQEAPPPRKMPRIPVNREAVAERKPSLPASREIQGHANVIDSERLRLGDFDLRLFGIVPPQLSASFGPQARAALDELTATQVTTCTVRDRDREGRFLATCRNAVNADLALELLKRGLAAAARGSIAGTDLAESYVAAEQAAASQKLGLWSVGVPAAAIIPEMPKAAPAPAANPAPTVAETPKPQEKPVEAAKPEPKSIRTIETIAKPPVPIEPEKPVTVENAQPNFFARYQLLITALVMLATALGMLGAFAIQRALDRRTEMKAIAAALRGELMAARAVCLGRLKTASDVEDKNLAWPRIRATLYQAYVGRLGWLGAELARRVASIYGQASDYASYYGGGEEMRGSVMPKRQALQTLVNHIDEVLPRLAVIEQTGSTRHIETGFSGTAVNAAEPSPAPQSPKAPSAARSSVAAIVPPVVQLWGKMRNMVQASWMAKKPPSPDPVAEYTALIEEEMKRFAFDESDDVPAASSASIAKFPETGT